MGNMSNYQMQLEKAEMRKTVNNGTPLTPQEENCVRMACDGLTNKQIAQRLGIAEGTVKCHMWSATKKKGMRNRTQLCVCFAVERNGQH